MTMLNKTSKEKNMTMLFDEKTDYPSTKKKKLDWMIYEQKIKYEDEKRREKQINTN